MHGATWDTFVKKFFPCKYKKIFYKYMDQPGTSLSESLSESDFDLSCDFESDSEADSESKSSSTLIKLVFSLFYICILPNKLVGHTSYPFS